jgi:hypothetical protein
MNSSHIPNAFPLPAISLNTKNIMGQSATLYGIDKISFQKIVDNPHSLDLDNLAKYSETFVKSFEGLRFVLSKGRDKNVVELVDKIFYPRTFIGEEVDFGNLDFENLPTDFDFENKAVYFNDPTMISNIASFLDTLSIEDFANQFDPDELNREGIYPGDIWNRHNEVNQAFNVRHMTEEYKNLKAFFNKLRTNKDYVLSFVG